MYTTPMCKINEMINYRYLDIWHGPEYPAIYPFKDFVVDINFNFDVKTNWLTDIVANKEK